MKWMFSWQKHDQMQILEQNWHTFEEQYRRLLSIILLHALQFPKDLNPAEFAHTFDQQAVSKYHKIWKINLDRENVKDK